MDLGSPRVNVIIPKLYKNLSLLIVSTIILRLKLTQWFYEYF